MGSLRISFGRLVEFSGGRAFADGPGRQFERKPRQMNARWSVKPRKAQVKDKGLKTECWDFEGWVTMMGVKAVKGASQENGSNKTVDPDGRESLNFQV